MKEYLIYDNIRRSVGVGHAFFCYNYAVGLSIQKKLKLIVPRAPLGTTIGNGVLLVGDKDKNFDFETFFGLDKHTDDDIKRILLTQEDQVEYEKCQHEWSPWSKCFLETKQFFIDRYQKAMAANKVFYAEHIVPDKINIAIHIRRGELIVNKEQIQRFKERLIPDRCYRQILDEILRTKNLSLKDVHVNIYSQLGKDGIYLNENAEPVDLKTIFEFENCSFYLDTDIYESMYNIINANIFIGGRNNLPLVLCIYREWLNLESYIDADDFNREFIELNRLTKTRTINIMPFELSDGQSKYDEKNPWKLQPTTTPPTVCQNPDHPNVVTEVINNKNVSIYTWPNPNFPFYYYLNHDKCRIFILENISHNFLWLKEAKNDIRPTDYFFVISGWYANKYVAELAKIIIDHLNLDKTKFIVMCNDFKELQHYLANGFTNSILLNHNAWLDETLYKIVDVPKVYNALLIGRPDKCKRLLLANKVKYLALVTGHVKYGNEVVELPPHVNSDDRRLTPNEITDMINKSHCGLCLSDVEGACYSSSEYLLCGVPVVSTYSLGGRDIWYEEDNSIVCDANPDAVAKSVEEIKEKNFKPIDIRNKHIILSKYFRRIFINELKSIFSRHNVTDLDAEKYYLANYVNHMKKSSTNPEVIIFLRGSNKSSQSIVRG